MISVYIYALYTGRKFHNGNDDHFFFVLLFKSQGVPKGPDCKAFSA